MRKLITGIFALIAHGVFANVEKPNLIFIMTDDMGYGDLGCNDTPDHQTPHRTPNIDRMAREGMRFTDFYTSGFVCTPSRAAFITGSYPRRTGLHNSTTGQVVWPKAHMGINPAEQTIAWVMKQAGYATACFGKWHLGDQWETLPLNYGFDEFLGIPYSNDMGPWLRDGLPPIPVIHNDKVIAAPVDQTTMTRDYTLAAIEFMKKNKNQPFFIYLAHPMPHEPFFLSDQFKGKSKNGDYGDAVEELDYWTGKLFDALKELNLDEKTIVIFTSDNGANRSGLTFVDSDGVRKPQRGSNLPFSGWKGSLEEGGMRMPFIVRWPGKVPEGTVSDELVTIMDMLPTFARLGGAPLPPEPIDGKDVTPILFGEPGAKSPHEAFYYYRVEQLQAVRSGKWKLWLPVQSMPGGDGTDVSILKNNEIVWGPELTHANTLEHDLKLSVNKGDKLRFQVSARYQHVGDRTRWVVEIADGQGQVWNSEKQFGGGQGENGWHYQYFDHSKSEYHDMEWIPNTNIWEGGGESCKLFSDGHHPHVRFDSVRTWIAPSDMTIRISGKPQNLSGRRNETVSEARLYDVVSDVGEKHNVIAQHPEVVARLMKLADEAREELGDVGIRGKGQRPAAWVENPTFRVF